MFSYLWAQTKVLQLHMPVGPNEFVEEDGQGDYVGEDDEHRDHSQRCVCELKGEVEGEIERDDGHNQGHHLQPVSVAVLIWHVRGLECQCDAQH